MVIRMPEGKYPSRVEERWGEFFPDGLPQKTLGPSSPSAEGKYE